jgi:hypothetical protein
MSYFLRKTYQANRSKSFSVYFCQNFPVFLLTFGTTGRAVLPKVKIYEGNHQNSTEPPEERL